jgi:hypothetical protein
VLGEALGLALALALALLQAQAEELGGLEKDCMGEAEA